MNISDAALDDLKARMPCHEVAAKWVTLRKARDAWVGPCPLCSRDTSKKSATKFKATDSRWMCAVCMDGGDVIELVRKVEGKSFTEAVEWLGGVQDIDQAEADRRKAEREKRQAEQDKASAEFRERERGTLYEAWQRGSRGAGSTVEHYLALRALENAPAHMLRCIEAMPYYDSGKKDAQIIHRGPAMLAAFTRAGKFSGLHITYLDLDRPNGKLQLPVGDDGEEWPAKKMRGSKAGGVIKIAGMPIERAFIGEGIETVLSVWCALKAAGLLRDTDGFYVAGDLGNLGGKARESVVHPTLKNEQGRARRVPGPWPDLESPGIALPDSISDLVILGDGDSDSFTTRCALARGCVRFERPGRRVAVAMAPDGSDYNDIWRATRDAAAVCALLESAAPLSPDAVMATAAAAPPPSSAANSASRGDVAEGGRLSSPSVDAPPPFDDADAPDMSGVASAKPDFSSAAAPAAGAPSAQDESAQPSRLPGEASAKPGAGERRSRGRPGTRSANRARWGGPPRKYGDGKQALDRWLAFFPMTELGLIERFVQRQKHRLKFCDAIGWLLWNGTHWTRTGAQGAAIAAGHEVVRAIQDEAEVLRELDLDEIIDLKPGKKKDDPPTEIMLADVLEQFGRASETKAKMTLHDHAAPYLAVEVDQLDADPFAINIQSGTLLVRRSWNGPPPAGWTAVNRYIRLKPHDQDDLITKIAPLRFDAAAECPIYDRFLEVVQPSAELRDFLDDWNGYSLTGDASEQRLVFHYGTGKNGKSTELAVRLALVGDYGRSIPIETFADQGKPRSAGQATPDLAMLRRVRTLATSEPEKGWKLNEGLIKNLTGGDEMAVRELHRAYFMLKPEFKFSITGNFKPNIGGGDADSGMWRRMTLVKWKVKIPPGQRDRDLVNKLKTEGSGILNRWLAGLSRWMERAGLKLPKEVEQDTEAFRVDSDPLGRFLAECTQAKEGGQVQSSVLHQLFCAWCKVAGEREWTSTGFGKAMREREFVTHKNSTHFWIGIELIKSVNDFINHEGKPLERRAGGGESAGEDEPPAWSKAAGDDDDVPI